MNLFVGFMRQKMITLCPTSYEIAQGMTNFSGWVRQQLLQMHVLEINKPRFQFACTDCDTIITTTQNLDNIPHATRRLGKFSNESCNGFLVLVGENDESS